MKPNRLSQILLSCGLAFTAIPLRADPEQDLIATLRSTAGAPQKWAACQRLRIIGTAKAVPAVAALLTDERMSQAARHTLEALPNPEADAALREALGQTSGLLRAGIVDSLGWRGQPAAVPLLAPLLSAPDTNVAAAAAAALGRLGGRDAIRALLAARDQAPATVRPTVQGSLLQCADRLAANSDNGGALSIYRELFHEKYPVPIRMAAWRGLVLSDPAHRTELLLPALAGTDRPVQLVALEVMRELNDPRVIHDCLGQWSSLPTASQLAVLDADIKLGAEALPTVRGASQSPHLALRVAAWRALGELNDVASVPALAQAAARAEPTERQAARESLARLRGSEASKALLAELDHAVAPEQAELLRALGDRDDRGAVAVLLRHAAADAAPVRLAALESLKKLAPPEALAPLLDRVTRSQSDDQRDAVFQALFAVCDASPNKVEATRTVVEAMGRFPAAEHRQILPLLAELGTTDALTAVQAASRSQDLELAREAARVLAQWPNAAPATTLLDLARTATDPTLQTLALRGAIDVAGQEPDALKRLAILQQALSAARRPEEKKQALGQIGQVPTPGALELALRELTNPDLRHEASLAVVSIAEKLAPSDPKLADAAAAKVLEQVNPGAVARRALALRAKPVPGLRFERPTGAAQPLSSPAAGASLERSVKLVKKAPGVNDNVNCSPRPFHDTKDVPLRTSIYFEVAPPEPKAGEALKDSLAVRLQPDQGDAVELLRPAGRFAPGAAGWIRPSGKSICVYADPGSPLKPAMRYTVHVSIQSPGDGQRTDVGSWSFTTEAAPAVHALNYPLDLRTEPVQWHGHFFDGICNVIFCTRATNYGPTWEWMAEARRQHPHAWGLQRDFWLTGMEFRGPEGFFPSNLPNIVRERETRRITALEPGSGGVVLRVEDFFGHEQYGIPAGRPAADDYHPGNEVLVADGYHSARAKVLATDRAAGTVTLSPFPTPAGGWKTAYNAPPPTHEDSDAPGLFPPGGCYLRKYDPPGTACYYWGRLDKEWDLAHRYGRRVMPNFADAPGDLSRDGQSWNTVKDYAQWHEVARAMAGHIIDRYGKDALGFPWSIFNEPDLLGVFWRGTWDDLQTYYDYTTDAILRAFEDRGYDSQKVFIGGLELGAIFGTNFVKLREFLAHCSPRASRPGALPRNAAVADRRLDGKRSRRVEALCGAHGGKGAPCDFISIHLYNRAEMSAAKLIRAKEIALEIDPDFYRGLWVDSHESCPDWMPPPDEAAGDVYLGDGYFPSWCADVVHRQLRRAVADPRFAYGETILTVWPPPDNFTTLNAVTRVIHFRANGDRNDRTATVPMPIFHVLNLLSDFGPRYWVLPEQHVGGHEVGGFASREARGTIRLLLYTHDAQDTQSRSAAAFEVTLDLVGVEKGRLAVSEYRFDKDHNSYYRLARALRKASEPAGTRLPGVPYYSRREVEPVQKLAECHPTRTAAAKVGADGRLRWTLRLAGNGLNIVMMEPAPPRTARTEVIPPADAR